jgi:hypothetical protein
MKDRKLPEPFDVIFSPLLYHSIKYNQDLKPDESYISDEELKEFEKFKSLFKDFLARLNKHDQAAFSVLSTMMQMWGYSRKYRGMCGRPIINNPGKVEGRFVCEGCKGSYEIAEKLYETIDKDEKTTNLRNLNEGSTRHAPKENTPRPNIKPKPQKPNREYHIN